MKSLVVLLTMFALVFFSVGSAIASDASELKDQISALQETISAQQKTIDALVSKVDSVEVKQAAQAKEASKVPELTKKINELKAGAKGPLSALTDGLTFGAHLKLALADKTDARQNGQPTHTNLSAGFFGRHNLIFYVTKELASWLKIDIQPEIDVAATATPSVGTELTRTSTSATSIQIHQAFMTVALPKGFEAKVGTFNPMYSEDYAKESWWHEMYNMAPGKCTLVAWHDSGAELYKSFDFDNWSLPVYLSYLNGGTDQNVDNNDAKTVLVHIAPEFFQSRFRLLGSFGYGKYDTKGSKTSFKSLAGFDWKIKKLNILGEYIHQVFSRTVIPSTGTSPVVEARRQGYWIRGVYTFNPRWKAVVEHSLANLYKSGLSSGQKILFYDKTRVTQFDLDFNLTPNSTIIGEYQYGDGHRSDGSQTLKFNRYTLGWRTTF